jgi:hypothetical protein
MAIPIVWTLPSGLTKQSYLKTKATEVSPFSIVRLNLDYLLHCRIMT